MREILLSPPLVFAIFIALGLTFSYLTSFLSAKGTESGGKYLSYACGQSNYANRISPDYSQFFPYAFFFTVMHVLVLVIATAPKDVLTLPLVYLAAGVLALVILFRR